METLHNTLLATRPSLLLANYNTNRENPKTVKWVYQTAADNNIVLEGTSKPKRSSDPLIGGADDVYRENVNDDLRDSALVDDEPLQSDTNHVTTVGDPQPDSTNLDEIATPYDIFNEDDGLSNLE